MNRSELIQQIHINTGLTKKDIGIVLDNQGEIAKSELGLEEGEITLPGIGKLKAITRSGRDGRNPKTGEAVYIPPKQAVKFVPSKEMKVAIN